MKWQVPNSCWYRFSLQQHVSHNKPGIADIDKGFYHEDNVHLILHDSQGFEPGEEANFNTVKRFIEERSKMPHLQDRLHAIWLVHTICHGTSILKHINFEDLHLCTYCWRSRGRDRSGENRGNGTWTWWDPQHTLMVVFHSNMRMQYLSLLYSQNMTTL